MTAIHWFLILLVGAGILAYRRSSLLIWTIGFAGFIGAIQLSSGTYSYLPWILFAIAAAILNIKIIRRPLLSKPLIGWFRSVLPPMSETEKTAIDAGTVWWDGDLFTGNPDWNKMLEIPEAKLSDEEQAFIDGPAEELCRMIDDWKINYELNDLPGEVWEFIKEHKFLGMIIPKVYGGLDFSPLAQSEVVVKISTRSVAAGVTIMVPNSLGPGELLMRYGTEEQKNHYLPRLASGEEIPAFALTNPYAGSDAGAMPDYGIVCKGEYNGKEVLGFRTSWEKRYITLGPISTLLGLAFKAMDPDGLLGDKEDLGITCALIPTDTPGVRIGERHKPGGSFQNGPNWGEDVFIPMDWIIGGEEYVGKGWRMLMDCLSVGRAISLPALGVGAGKLTSRMTGAYARIRKQFRVPIGKFEGIEEALARIGGIAYRMDASRCMTAAGLNLGEQPSVLSAILKYHNTEGMRQVINDAMDVHGGRGVCIGPRNYLASTYRTLPVAITVEGANILTRSLIIFGQGAIRCHPYILREMLAAGDDDHARGLKEFDDAMFAHVGFTISNAVRAFVTGLTRAVFVKVPDTGPMKPYLRQLSRMSAAFTFTADVTLLMLGGELKRREKLSARFGDILSHLYMSSAVVKHFIDQGQHESDLPLAQWALEDSLHIMEQRLEQILSNYPNRVLGRLLRFVVMPVGRSYRGADDKLGHQVASLLLEPSDARDRLTDGMYINTDPADRVGRVEAAFQKAVLSDPIEARIRKETGLIVTAYDYEEPIAKALAAGVINDMEAKLVRETKQLVADALQVDVFPGDAAVTSDSGDVAHAG